MNLQINDIVEYIDPSTNEKSKLTYLGKREVKQVLFDFFMNDKKETLFFYPSQVDLYMKAVSKL